MTTRYTHILICNPLVLRGLCAGFILVSICQGRWAQSTSAFELLGRGVNFGNMLESPREGERGVRFEDDFPKQVKAAGFDSVRIPVRWSSHSAQHAPYSIDPKFIARVQHVVALCPQQDLKVVLNVHHFEQLYADPVGNREWFLAIWRQISEAFKNSDSKLTFELLNEPHDKLDSEQWNELLVEVASHGDGIPS